MRRFREISLDQRLNLVIIVTAMVALFFSSVGIVAYQERIYRQIMEEELATLADVLGANGSAALVFDVPAEARDILASLEAKSQIRSAAFLDAAGEIFAVYEREAGSSTAREPSLGDVVLERPIRFDGEEIGTVRIRATAEPLARRVRAAVVTAFLAFLICSLLALVLGRRMLRVIAAPITRLMATAQKISESRDFSIRATREADDDLGRLIDSFNNMLDQIQAADHELQQAHGELELRLVELRQEKEELYRTQEREKALQERLSRSQRMESLAVLAGGVAHDLNNILGPMVAYPDLILSTLPPEHRLRASVARIGDSARKAAGVIQDFLTLGRRGNYETEPVDLESLITSYIDSPGFIELQERYPQIGLELALSGIPPIRGSVPHLTQLVMNLIINAFEAMAAEGLLTVESALVTLDEDLAGFETVPAGEYCLLKVSDTGPGISPTDLGHIFEPFYTRKKLGRSGSGLGLAVVYGVAKDLGGYIDVRSVLRQGTEFLLYFAPEAASEESGDSLEEDFSGDEKILVVDDVREQRDLAVHLLESFGYDVLVAENGHQALEIVAAEDVDLVLLDMIMEDGFDGLETFRGMRRLRPHLRCVVASGFSESDRVREAQTLGAGPYIGKPYTRHSLGRAVRETLDR